METTTNPEANMTSTDSLGYTEREWENFFSSKSQDDGCQTAHCSKFDDESYCESCDQTVDYSDGSKYGKCGCTERDLLPLMDANSDNPLEASIARLRAE